MWIVLLTTLLAGSVAPESPRSDQEGATVAAFIRVKGQQELRLTCGGGEGSVKFWLTPFGEIRSPGLHSDPVYMHPDGTLTLSRTSSLHAGRYRCLLRHRGGSTMFLYDLQVDPRSHKSPEIQERSGRRVRSVLQEDQEQGHMAATVAASLLMTFVVGFSFGALGRTQFFRCFEAITRRFKSPRRAQRADSPEEDSDVSMATLPSVYDNQAFQVECDGDVTREDPLVPPKPQRSFRSRTVDQEVVAEVETEKCDLEEEEKRSSETEKKGLEEDGEEMKDQGTGGEEERRSDDGRGARTEEEKQQEGEVERWRTRGLEFSIDMWSDVEMEKEAGNEEEIWGGRRSGEEDSLRREEEERRSEMEEEVRICTDGTTEEKRGEVIDLEEREDQKKEGTGQERDLKVQNEVNYPEEEEVNIEGRMWITEEVKERDPEEVWSHDEKVRGPEDEEDQQENVRDEEEEEEKVQEEEQDQPENVRDEEEEEKDEEEEDHKVVYPEEVNDQESEVNIEEKDQQKEARDADEEEMDQEEEEDQQENVRDEEEEEKDEEEEDHKVVYLEEVNDQESEVKDQEKDQQKEARDAEEEMKVQQEMENEEDERKSSDEDNISKRSSSDSEEEAGGEKQEESRVSPPSSPSPPRGRRSRVIRLYQYDEEGQPYSHLPTPDPAAIGPAPRLKQRSPSLTRLSAIMAAASAGPLDAPQTGSDATAFEKPFFHMEI